MITPRAALAWIAIILSIVIGMTQIPIARSQTMLPPGTPATPNSVCGAEGVGLDPVSHAIVRRQTPGYRVDERGNWVECDRPCIPAAGQGEAFRTWSVGPHQCTTFDSYASDAGNRARDRVLRHGEFGYWQQWLGQMRGHLIEQCDDGRRSAVSVTCEPATHCDTSIRIERDGVAYSYDARPSERRVPLGATVDALSDDGRRWPVACVDGDLVAPTVLPPPPPAVRPSAPAAPAEPGCGPQTIRRGGQTAVYAGPRVAEGGSVVVRLGMRYVPVWCRAAGRMSLDPPALTRERAASAADAWRRAMPH